MELVVPSKPVKPPQYLHQREKGRADRAVCYVYSESGARVKMHLGNWMSPESLARFERVLADFRRRQGGEPSQLPTIIRRAPDPSGAMTVNDLVVLYDDYCLPRYTKAGKPTSEMLQIRQAMRPLCRMCGDLPIAAVTPAHLASIREDIILHGTALRGPDGKPVHANVRIRRMGRKTVNQHVRRIQKMFWWASRAERAWLDPSVYDRLNSLTPLTRRDRVAPEPRRREMANPEHVRATLPHLPPPVRAMVELQLITGARGDEIRRMRPMDIDRESMKGQGLWVYTTEQHKTDHHDDAKPLTLYLNSMAQAIIRPFLDDRPSDAPLFSPRQALPIENAGHLTEMYRGDVYRRAIERACQAAGVPKWTPHQLRHLAVTLMARAHGMEMARRAVGHTTIDTTAIYTHAELADRAAVALAMRAHPLDVAAPVTRQLSALAV